MRGGLQGPRFRSPRVIPTQKDRSPLTFALNRRNWIEVDGTGLIVGRLASTIAHLLQGKHKPFWTPDKDVGDYIVVTNCEKVIFTGKKWQQKMYRSHSLYPGGLKEIQVKEMLMNHPDRIISKAVWGMLPKNKLRKERLHRLKIYPEQVHNHQAQLAHSITPKTITELFNRCKWKATDFDPEKHEGVLMTLEHVEDRTLVTTEDSPGKTKVTFKREIKAGRTWKRPALLKKSWYLKKNFQQIIKEVNRRGKMKWEDFPGWEKSLSEDEEPVEFHRRFDSVLLKPGERRVPLAKLPPVEYPAQKNLRKKIRAKWLSRLERAQQKLKEKANLRPL